MMWETPVLLILIGILSALVGAAVSYLIEVSLTFRMAFIELTTLPVMIGYIIFSLIAAAAANFVTQVRARLLEPS